MSVKQATRLVIVDVIKIADITHADTNEHPLDLVGLVPPNAISLLLVADRVSGTGNMTFRPRSSGAAAVMLGKADEKPMVNCPILYPELLYKLTNAGDEWDLLLCGYFVEPRTR